MTNRDDEIRAVSIRLAELICPDPYDRNDVSDGLIELARLIAAPQPAPLPSGPFAPGELTAKAREAADGMRAAAQRPFIPFEVPAFIQAQDSPQTAIREHVWGAGRCVGCGTARCAGDCGDPEVVCVDGQGADYPDHDVVDGECTRCGDLFAPQAPYTSAVTDNHRCPECRRIERFGHGFNCPRLDT